MKITKSAYIKEGINTDRYTNEGIAIETEIRQAVMPILEKYARRGYSMREMAHLAHNAIFDVECSWIIMDEAYKAQVED